LRLIGSRWPPRSRPSCCGHRPSSASATWAFALNRTTAGRLGSTTYLVPPVAILLAWLILGEVPPVIAFLGGALCIGGVVVARTRGRSS